MTFSFQYAALSSAEEEQFSYLLRQCFNSLSESTYIKRIGVENFRALHQGDRLAGGLAILPMGQWYGGQCVPMAGIAAVAIAPEYRGAGAAIALMQNTLHELRERGILLSILYPATQRLYRKAGYEQAGVLCTWEVDPKAIQSSDRSLPVHPITPSVELLAPLYRQKAQSINGYVERHSALWQELMNLKPDGAIARAYGFGELEQLEGYIIFHQVKAGNSNRLIIKDWVMLTPGAVQRFWTFLADHRSQIDQVRWRSSPSDSLTVLLPEQSAYIVESERWMMRILDASKALEKRGYPSVQAELHFDLQDDLFVENNDKFVLSVSNGKSEVIRGGNGDFKLNIRTLSALYSGFFSPQELALVGRLEATHSALMTATQLFTPALPWMSDFF